MPVEKEPQDKPGSAGNSGDGPARELGEPESLRAVTVTGQAPSSQSAGHIARKSGRNILSSLSAGADLIFDLRARVSWMPSRFRRLGSFPVGLGSIATWALADATPAAPLFEAFLPDVRQVEQTSEFHHQGTSQALVNGIPSRSRNIGGFPLAHLFTNDSVAGERSAFVASPARTAAYQPALPPRSA